ncbi:undecaprenyl diphosphate synthase [Geomicrobium halophilum]|uniref:Isoprenyl transferase n=1 Tax=Geomicrobium halophilum TaxID=549000 RepID=A0A841Q0X8_9BACL|nr:isoprenyl transferase [Geomicrobium halophilum]MBB6449278.1 undecaprenyl diphosphate synthase [Geomicrobium halophilum]
MLDRFLDKQNGTQPVDVHTEVPEHVAIILDGNGRWARKRGMPRNVGHREGMKTIHRITESANEMGVKVLTLFAFSTENWVRPKTEVDFILRLPERFLTSELPKLQANNVQVRLMGAVDELPAHTKKAVDRVAEETAGNDGIMLNLALNYGGRSDIVRAAKKVCEQVQQGNFRPGDINEEMISEHLFTKELPDPDLLIRTSGELRLSNFMLWQMAYSEFWFTDVLWPDFSTEDFVEAIQVYQKRKRRYGGV